MRLPGSWALAPPLALALFAGRALGLALELPLSQPNPHGPFAVHLSVGTPPQRLWLRVDSASQWTYVPDAAAFGKGGFSSENSSTAKLGEEKIIPFMDGSSVTGVLLRDDVEIGGVRAALVPLLLARNATPPAPELGLLGLFCLRGSDFGADSWNPFTGEAPRESRLLQRGLFEYFWEQHAEVAQTFRLELGGRSPRLVVGGDTPDKPRSEGGVRFLSTIFTSRSSQWFASIRAVGLSKGKSSPLLKWNLDFNALVPFGAPALLDSGSPAIRLGHVVYERFLLGLPSDCRSTVMSPERATKVEGTTCACKPGSIEEDFPSISLSFESADTFRFLGLDSGADTIVCIPPQAYVTYDPAKKRCIVAVSDGGLHHLRFGYEAIVLGLPFFRSTAVVLDAGQRRVGLGPPLPVGTQPPAANSQHSWDSQTMGETSIQRVDGPAGPTCLCADPKNWWSTGKRFSPRRVLVVIIGVTLLVGYVFVAHSPSATAEGLRDMAENLCGSAHDYGQRFPADDPSHDGAGNSANGGSAFGPAPSHSEGNRRRSGPSAAAAAAERRFTENSPDRPLIQMADRSNQ